MGRAVLGQESGYLTLPHASQGASARLFYFQGPSAFGCTAGRQPASLWGFKEQDQDETLLHSRAYQAQRQMRLHSSSSLYDGRHTRPRCTRTRDRRDRGCVGLDPLERQRICKFQPVAVPLFLEPSVLVSFLHSRSPYLSPTGSPSAPSGLALAPLPFAVHSYFQIRISQTLVTNDIMF